MKETTKKKNIVKKSLFIGTLNYREPNMPPGNDKHIMSDLISTCESLQRQKKTYGYQQKLWKHPNASWHEKEERYLTQLMFHSAVAVSHVRAAKIPADYYRLIQRFLSSDPWALHIKQTADIVRWVWLLRGELSRTRQNLPKQTGAQIKEWVVHSLLYQGTAGLVPVCTGSWCVRYESE